MKQSAVRTMASTGSGTFFALRTTARAVAAMIPAPMPLPITSPSVNASPSRTGYQSKKSPPTAFDGRHAPATWYPGSGTSDLGRRACCTTEARFISSWLARSRARDASRLSRVSRDSSLTTKAASAKATAL
ncbi:hypothetical protein [Clavibacter tessellarius]|uniref:hypothetical protein n=1 Tax=Clavibacter tessellarius TaxID=31965 RepID=UPI003253BFD3